ncbi:hypothetical protein P9112_013101 [Eukaryota sp. TZLM1-RC]
MSYLFQKILTDSSFFLLNPLIRLTFKTSVHTVKPCHSSLLQAVIDAYATADVGETFLDAILGTESDLATVLWSDKTTTEHRIAFIKNTAAYQRILKLPEERRKDSAS